MYVPPRWSPVAGLRDAEPRTDTGVDIRRCVSAGGGGWIVSVDARVRAYNSADVFDAGIFPSPAVTRCSGDGGRRGWEEGEGERERGRKKKKEGLVSAQQEARCSADKRIFRLTTRDHILQLMRLDLTLRYFSPASRESSFSPSYPLPANIPR